MRRSIPLFLTVILGLLAVSPAGFAQETTATIIGTVSDESGGVLPGVTVTLRQVATNQTFERVTSAEGLYTAPLLPIGEFQKGTQYINE